MTGAIEFLRKAKAICQKRNGECFAKFGSDKCPVFHLCCAPLKSLNEADLVRKVMEYQIKEDADAERN